MAAVNTASAAGADGEGPAAIEEPHGPRESATSTTPQRSKGEAKRGARAAPSKNQRRLAVMTTAVPGYKRSGRLERPAPGLRLLQHENSTRHQP